MTHGKLNKTTLPSELPSPNIATCSKMVLERTFSLHYIYIYIRWFQTSISDAETKHDRYIYIYTNKKTPARGLTISQILNVSSIDLQIWVVQKYINVDKYTSHIDEFGYTSLATNFPQ